MSEEKKRFNLLDRGSGHGLKPKTSAQSSHDSLMQAALFRRSQKHSTSKSTSIDSGSAESSIDAGSINLCSSTVKPLTGMMEERFSSTSVGFSPQASSSASLDVPFSSKTNNDCDSSLASSCEQGCDTFDKRASTSSGLVYEHGLDTATGLFSNHGSISGTPDLGIHGSLLSAHGSAYICNPSLHSGRRRIMGGKPSQFKSPKELLMSVQNVVKTRSGSVLGRQTILKSDHFETGLHSHLDFHLQGAPNFRMADMNVFGVAQPTVPGITTVLTLLGCHPVGSTSQFTTWISTREEPLIYLNRKPFVIRDAGKPTQNIKTYHGINSSRLEQVEARLKEDILREELRWHGLVLVHEESSGGQVFPSWMAVESLQTPREVFEDLVKDDYRVSYIRIPVSPEQAPDDRYIDEYVRVIRNTHINENLVFNCGMGVGRTTFAMVLAMLLRRGQAITETSVDPFVENTDIEIETSRSYSEIQLARKMEIHNRAILRLVYIVDQTLAFQKISNKSTIEWAVSKGALIDDLKEAILGNFHCIQQLIAVLADGNSAKKALDQAINRCDVLTNLREDILTNRLLYSTTMDTNYLQKAFRCLEQYFLLLAFCSYVNKLYAKGFKRSFNEWLKSRPEIWNIIENLRRDSTSLSLFRPIEDLSVFSEDMSNTSSLVGWGPNQKPATRELDKHVIKSRKGIVLGPQTILKEDFWSKEKEGLSTIEGAANFRKISGFRIYAVAQPTIQGMRNVILSLGQSCNRIVWINLREEPLVYINGNPYVLRDQYLTLRNIKSYSGITGSRLEIIEEKLSEDVREEIIRYNGRVLLHTETHGTINPIWQDCKHASVMTPHELVKTLREKELNEPFCTSNLQSQSFGHSSDSMEANTSSFQLFSVSSIDTAVSPEILYFRVPVTSESPPDPSDFDHIVHLLCRYSGSSSCIIVNCQVGLGRSTTGTVIASLVFHWLKHSIDTSQDVSQAWMPTSKPLLNYRPIHSLLRVIRNGVECKRIVDDTIDNCAQYVNLREIIEISRQAVESETDQVEKAVVLTRAILHLKRYFMLILFQSYLQNNEPGVESMLVTFQEWLQKHPEFATICEELESGGLDALTPVEELAPGDGIALTSEVVDVVNRRDGGVLAQGTIIKYDMFPGAQKLSLNDRIEGAHNFRGISFSSVRAAVESEPFEQTMSALSLCSDVNLPSVSASVYGVGMPTKEGIRRTLRFTHADSTGDRTLYWTSLREEPVIYINGKPYVLRLFQNPLKNLEATGISRERVELMEAQMKEEILRDMHRYNGRLLLHEERVEPNAQFSIVPVWESVTKEDIETPLDVYARIKAEGYRIDYMRIPITDEQAPIPDVFDQLMERLLTIGVNGDAIFNCQMGRGRTTTGIVTACLMQMTVGNACLIENSGRLLHKVDTEDEVMDGDRRILTRMHDSEIDLHERFKSGEYQIVMQLIAVLQYGKLAKFLTDKAIDMSEHMQNLRLAIFDYRLRLLAAEPDSRKFHTLLEVGWNYLIRYFYLIVFADYLIEIWSLWVPDTLLSESEMQSLSDMQNTSITQHDEPSLPASRPITFSAWLSDRKEILNIIRKNNQMIE
ncbi:hypothetical protein O5D80_007110 [Batrachochytrium dendrobatidis]|nr:hypothetical protein O5D80_007110 [Batrachochytrium dendrobatidis]